MSTIVPTMSAVSDVISNTVDLSATASYAAIIGECPSKGARSPLLWNAVYQDQGLETRMVPLDIPAADLQTLIAALKADRRFVGGAVTMPHKALILPFLDRVDPLAERIGAVNALYRDGDALVGTNTDGAGALASLVAAIGADPSAAKPLGARRVVLIGCGGAGTAVATFVADALAAKGSLTLINRDPSKAEVLAERLASGDENARTQAPVMVALGDAALETALTGADLLINCTSLGFGPAPQVGTANLQRIATPLAPAPTSVSGIAAHVATAVERLSLMAADAVVFDAIYQPLETQLLMLAQATGRRALGGKPMNLEQAVLGFHNATPSVPLATVRSVMALVP